jgi:hypothetical protein
MATYIVVEDKIPEWQDWLRAKILMHSEDDDPEVLKMYQVMASAPLEIIEASVELHVSINRERARQLSEITEGMNLND